MAEPFSEVTMELHAGPEDRAVDLTVHALPLPPPAFELAPGYVADTWLERTTEGDPRGPMVNFLAEFPEPGRYRVGVGWTEGEPYPHIELLTHDSGVQNAVLELLGGDDTYDAEFFDVTEPGLYPVRVSSCPDCPDQQLQVEVQVEE